MGVIANVQGFLLLDLCTEYHSGLTNHWAIYSDGCSEQIDNVVV